MAGILKVCADVFRAIDDSTSFSIVQLATEARKQHSKLFQEIVSFARIIYAIYQEKYCILFLVYPVLHVYFRIRTLQIYDLLV